MGSLRREPAAWGATATGSRARTTKLTTTLQALPDSQWTTITLDRRGAHNRPQVHDQDVTVRGCPVPLRQIAVRGLRHEHPTLILTNDRTSPAKQIVGRYAKRVFISTSGHLTIESRQITCLNQPPPTHPTRCRFAVWESELMGVWFVFVRLAARERSLRLQRSAVTWRVDPTVST